MWPDSDETQELLKSADAGDGDAVNALLERHREAVQKMVRMRLDRGIAARVDASDIVQDVMLEASQRLSDYVRNDESMPFHLWLRQLAKDRMIDAYRKHRTAQRRSVDREKRLDGQFSDRSSLNLAAQIQDQELTPAAAMLRRELEQRFLLALEDLNEDDREMIQMRHQEHLSNSEVAQTLGLSAAAAGMRYLRALRKLRDVLGNDHSVSQ
ncbi:MAG: sigma-70 family RNA polymerase sigma factor [Planctomycetaceae bacterium]